MAKFLATCVILTSISGCCSTPVHAPLGVPPRPILIDVTQEQWERLEPEIQDIWSYNDLELKKHIRKLEERLKMHDKAADL